MDEMALRWSGRIGSLKSISLVIAIIVGLFLCIAISQFLVTLQNGEAPIAVSVEQLADGEIGADRWVEVHGTAAYQLGYQATENGKPVTSYYYLIGTGHTLVVKSPKVIPDVKNVQDRTVTISGLTHGTPSDLRKVIEDDLPDIRQAGFTTTSSVYLGEGERPTAMLDLILIMAGLAIVVVLCLIPLFFPSTVFAPQPVQVVGGVSSGGPGVKATGRFLKLKNVQPSIELGRGSQNFREAVANLVTLPNGMLMIYIHHVLTYRYAFVPVWRRATDWGVFVDSINAIDAVPGKIYGWSDRWAVRLRYRDEKEKPASVIVSFNHAAAQADFVACLRDLRIPIGART